jgi:phosphate/sulfate permease
MVAMAETADTSKDPLGEATGIMRFVYKGSEAALRAISTRQTAAKRQQPLPSAMVVVAYTMAGLWMLIAMYFSIIFGLKFPSAQSRSWVMAFGISLVQDMVVQQSIRVAAKTTISLVVMPRIAAFLAGRILNAYRKPQEAVRRPAASAN